MLAELSMSKPLNLDAGTSSPLRFHCKRCHMWIYIYPTKMTHSSICKDSHM
jgi:hypothetical protein